MSVWCVSLMALLGRLAQETQGDSNIEEMLKNAAGALRKGKRQTCQVHVLGRLGAGKENTFYRLKRTHSNRPPAASWGRRPHSGLQPSTRNRCRLRAIGYRRQSRH